MSRSALSSGASGRSPGRRVAVEGDRARRPARPAGAGTASPCRRGRRRQWPARRSGRGRTTHRSSSTVETCVPMLRSPAAISSVSRARSGWRRVLDPTETAASTSARAVIDFEPGRRTVSRPGRAVGAGHGASGARSGADRPTSAVARRARESGTATILPVRVGAVPAAARYGVPACAGGTPRRAARPTWRACSTRRTRPTASWSRPTTTSRRPTRCRSCAADRRVEPGRSPGSVARWGLVPAWARDASGAARMINARAETVATSRGVRPAVRPAPLPGAGRRLVRVGALAGGQRKQPYFMTRAGR